MSVSWIGPVETEILNPQFSWDGTPEPGAVQQASLDGVVEWSQLHQVIELVTNPERRVTIGRHQGVLEYLHTSDDLLAPWRGWYLLQTVAVSSGQEHSRDGLAGLVPFSLHAVFLGAHREPVLTHSARDRGGDVTQAAIDAVADPFVGGSFLLSPGGTLVTRTYDPLPRDPLRDASVPENLAVYVEAL